MVIKVDLTFGSDLTGEFKINDEKFSAKRVTVDVKAKELPVVTIEAFTFPFHIQLDKAHGQITVIGDKTYKLVEVKDA